MTRMFRFLVQTASMALAWAILAITTLGGMLSDLCGGGIWGFLAYAVAVWLLSKLLWRIPLMTFAFAKGVYVATNGFRTMKPDWKAMNDTFRPEIKLTVADCFALLGEMDGSNGEDDVFVTLGDGRVFGVCGTQAYSVDGNCAFVVEKNSLALAVIAPGMDAVENVNDHVVTVRADFYVGDDAKPLIEAIAGASGSSKPFLISERASHVLLISSSPVPSHRHGAASKGSKNEAGQKNRFPSRSIPNDHALSNPKTLARSEMSVRAPRKAEPAFDRNPRLSRP